MREIKFRGWDKKDKVMREIYGIQFPKISNHGNRKNTIIEMHCSDYEGQRAIILSDFTDSIERIELMQYTGLKDKNNVEIFEGDILMHHYFKEKGTVLWHTKQSRWALEYLTDKKTQELWPIDKNSFEVIGNIYENPELLEEKKQ